MDRRQATGDWEPWQSHCWVAWMLAQVTQEAAAPRRGRWLVGWLCMALALGRLAKVATRIWQAMASRGRQWQATPDTQHPTPNTQHPAPVSVRALMMRAPGPV